jgi:CMP-N,N'-diacetyllegionaminic acid synthase
MRILALIPARAGSKRLPNKNKLMLGDKPLVAWSIECAKGLEFICDILVSTDDLEIATIAKQYGAMVPWLRPAELATDESHVVDTLIHATDWYETNLGKVDGILLLQPTSPLRRKETIKAALQLYKQGHCIGSIVSLSKVKTHPAWCFQLGNEGTLRPLSKEDGFTKRVQDLELVYGLNGLIYVMNSQELRATKKIIGKKTKGIVIDPGYETMDIDTQDDFDLAEFYLAKHL